MADIVPIKAHRDYERKSKRSAAGVLRDCRALHPTEVLVIGTAANGDLIVQGSPPNPMMALWLMELAKRRLMGLD